MRSKITQPADRMFSEEHETKQLISSSYIYYYFFFNVISLLTSKKPRQIKLNPSARFNTTKRKETTCCFINVDEVMLNVSIPQTPFI